MHCRQVTFFTTLCIYIYARSNFWPETVSVSKLWIHTGGPLQLLPWKLQSSDHQKGLISKFPKSLWSADHAFPILTFTSLEVIEQQLIHDPRKRKSSTFFKDRLSSALRSPSSFTLIELNMFRFGINISMESSLFCRCFNPRQQQLGVLWSVWQ